MKTGHTFATRILAINAVIICVIVVIAAVSCLIDFKQQTIMLAGVAILIAGITAAINFFAVLKRLSPLRSAADAATKAAEGNLMVRIASGGSDEVGLMLISLDLLIRNTGNFVNEVRSFADKMASRSEKLTESSVRISGTVSQEAGQANQIATAAEEMTQTFVDIAKTTSDLASSSSESAEAARQGEEIVGRSVQETEKIAAAVNESSEIMRFLGERSKEIGAIVEVIKDIADQTNLLALNAAIEAARAGEQGRGFAVVADEVRKLAEKTTVSTSQIGNMIGTIQQEVEKAITAMEGASHKVQAGVALSREAGDSLASIVTRTSELQGMVQQIAAATEVMSSVSEQISSDIQTVAGSSNEISSGAGHMTEASGDLSRIASDLRDLVSKFRV